MKTTNATAFTDLLRNYETSARHRNESTETEKAYATALTDLATACTFSVLKKLLNAGGYVDGSKGVSKDSTSVIRTLRRDLAKDLHDLNCLAYASTNATAQEYNADGELITVIKDKDLHDTLTALCGECFGDGIDLMHTATIAILTETEKATDLTTNFMETPYNVRRLKRKVYIKGVDSLGGYENVQTTAIQEVYKAIRRDIESNRSIQVASHKYTYISDIMTDTESDIETAVYKRLPKYSGLAYETFDTNGKVTSITADAETVRTTDELIAQMNLTKRQATVLQLRQSGYGYKAIATYLGIKPDKVQRTVKAIQTKAIAIGLTPHTATADAEE